MIEVFNLGLLEEQKKKMDKLLFIFYLVAGSTMTYVLIQVLYCTLDKNAILFDAKKFGWTNVTIKWIFNLNVSCKGRYYRVTYNDEENKTTIRYLQVTLLHRFWENVEK